MTKQIKTTLAQVLAVISIKRSIYGIQVSGRYYITNSGLAVGRLGLTVAARHLAARHLVSHGKYLGSGKSWSASRMSWKQCMWSGGVHHLLEPKLSWPEGCYWLVVAVVQMGPGIASSSNGTS